ncbi:MAG: DUF1573 domain-containing protein [Flavobacteriales bacterium]|nr:DUF1573 domain-containing protein [Bacteroidota bacterium]MCB9241375.1 DUF1573 domain-containing protein [Flavobacteriales bacterium]
MKRSILTLLIAIGFAAAGTAQDAKVSVNSDGGAKLKFDKTEHDFGTVKEGTQATVTFKFKNEGTEPLVLTSVQASCGCTTPKWTKEPIAPGDYGEVTAIYNSKNRPGNFTKTITVRHNGEGGTEYLTIRGFVEKAEEKPAPPVQANPQ